MASLWLNPSAVARALGAAAFILVVLHLAGQFSKLALGHGSLKGLVPLFNLSAEQNIPAYFSVLLILLAALILAGIAAINHGQNMPHTSKWTLLSIGFLCMAFDEAFSIHERLMVPLRAMMGVSDAVGTVKGEVVLGIFYYAWVIPGMVIVLLLGLYFLRFLLYLPARTRYRFLCAAVLYVGGAIGFELIGGAYAEVHGYDNWTYTIIATTEEALEMAGVICFIWALLKYCGESYGYVRLAFVPQDARASVSRPATERAEPRITTRPA